jgi:hypothetical protein
MIRRRSQRERPVMVAQVAALRFQRVSVRKSMVHQDAQAIPVPPSRQAQTTDMVEQPAGGVWPASRHFGLLYQRRCCHSE